MIRDDVVALAVMVVVFVGCTIAEALMKPLSTWDAEAQRERARDRVMAGGADDDRQCHLCQRVTAVRELVMLHDDAALCCLGCATILKYQRAAA